jgi:hypothetical protein
MQHLQHKKKMKHLKHAIDTLVKIPEKLENHCKHMTHLDKTLAAYI